MSEPHEIAERTFDAGMSLALPISTHHNGTEVVFHVTGSHPVVTDHAGPFDIAKADCLARLDIAVGGPLRPTPRALAALPPWPGAPVGFSKDIERDSRR